MTRLSVCGSGRVGKALGKALHSKGYPVLFYDILEKQLEPLKQEGYETSVDMDALRSVSDVIFTAVPTEALPNGDCDLSNLHSVCEQLRRYDGIFVQVSTCPPMTARRMSKLMRKAEYVVHPSFYSMARMEADALHPVNVLLGSKDGKPVNEVTDIFRRFDGPINWGPWEEAEFIKYADNCLSATLITYWNQLFLIAEKMRLDIDKVARIVDRDPQYRSIYRFAGRGAGGACLPKDLAAFTNFVTKELKGDATLLKAVQDLNNRMIREYGEGDRHLIYRP